MPTPLAATRLVPPDSLMDAVDEASFQRLLADGALGAKYAQAVDRESAHEMISARLGTAKEAAGVPAAPAGSVPLPPPPPGSPPASPKPAPKPRPKAESKPKATSGSKPKEGDGVGDQVKGVAVDFAKDMLTTADGRKTLRSVFGTLFGKK